jgi:hypothetical protein
MIDAAAQFGRELDVTDDLREQLGLDDSDALRLLQAQGRTILLERVRESDGIAVPWDRDLVLSAGVESFPMADVLAMLHKTKKSGFLLFGFAEHEKSVFLHRGEVVFAASNQDVDRLGSCLFRGGVISLEDLRECEKRWLPNHPLGKILVERGCLTPRELWNGVKFQVEEIVRSLFAYTSGSVHFWEGEIQPDNVVRLALPTRRLISEGLKQRDELLRFLAAVEDPCVRLIADAKGGEGLSGNSKALFETIMGEPNFLKACRKAEIDPLSGARTIQLLRIAGAIQVERDADAAAAGGGAPKQECQAQLRDILHAHMKLIAELTAPLVSADGPEAVEERMQSLLDDVSGRYPKLLKNLRCGRAGGIDPAEVERRALRISGDRERHVRDALAEVVTYLEFELRNHPKIADAEIFLDALEGLRATLDI